jgi:acyl-CoA synthetase (AMP-forming)/AMP-acid ligase II
MGPSIDYAVAYQAIVRCGAVASGINPRLALNEQESIFDRMLPVVTVAEDELVSDLGESAGIPLARSAAAGVPVAPFAPEEDREPSDLVAVVWTSGTTGLPKGAMFDHRSLRAVSEGTDLLSQPGDRKLSPLPFAHVGYMTRAWDEISNGVTTIITPNPWRAPGALQTIVDERVTVAQGVPTQWSLILELDALVDADVSSLRLVSTGAARMAPSQVAQLRERFRAPVVVRYTSTETSLGTGTRLDDDDETIASTVGRPVAGVEMELVDQDGDEVARGEVGRVRLRSGAVMLGYVAPRDPKRVGEPLVVDRAATDLVRSQDGWITTGDFGVLDEKGNLSLVGRDNEMYQRGGYNVYPAEIEQALDGAPGVQSVAVVAGSDDVLGEVGVAFVVATEQGDVPTQESLKAFLRDRIADYKAPDVVVVKDELPVTAMGKIDKKVLRAEADLAAHKRAERVAASRRARR